MELTKPKKGSLAKQALSNSDLDDPNYDPKMPIRQLEEDRLLYVNALIHAEINEQAQLKKRISKLTTVLNETERERYREKQNLYQTRRNRLQEWTRLGLSERITMLRIGEPAKFAVIAALTLLDFYVFAEAVAIATDTAASLSNVRFLIGGIFGMVMALLGFFFGRVLKNWSVLPAQRNLGRALRAQNPAIELPVTSNTGFAAPLVLGLAFALTLIAGAIVRLQANVEPNIGLLVFQVLLPLAVAVIEFLLYDPLEIKTPSRSRKHQKLENELTNLTVAQGRIDERYSQRRSTTNAVYAIELSTLRQILQDHAIYVNDDVETRAIQEARRAIDQQNRDAETQRDAAILNESRLSEREREAQQPESTTMQADRTSLLEPDLDDQQRTVVESDSVEHIPRNLLDDDNVIIDLEMEESADDSAHQDSGPRQRPKSGEYRLNGDRSEKSGHPPIFGSSDGSDEQP